MTLGVAYRIEKAINVNVFFNLVPAVRTVNFSRLSHPVAPLVEVLFGFALSGLQETSRR